MNTPSSNDRAFQKDALPNGLPRPPDELPRLEAAWRMPEGLRRVTAVNNTYIGRLYMGTAMLFLLLAGILGLLIRAQLAVPGNTLLSAGQYNQVFTMHGTVMMFLFAVPIVEAIAVYLLPNMLGARDLPFPRLSAYAFWAYAVGGIAFFCTLFWGLAPDGGWFMYPPLTGRAHSPGLGADFWLLGIGFIEISAIAGAIELIIGILMTRAPGMTLGRMPVYAWAMLVVGFMIVLAFPAVIAGTMLLEMERAFDWPFFIAERGGDPLLWQHLFWFFGHPEVYIIFLPAAGMVSMMLPTLAGTRLVGHRAVVGALIGTAALSFLLWAHHMFTAGLGPLATMLVSVASLAVAVPTAVQVFAWMATLAKGRLRWRAPSLFLIGFFITFVMGGLTGVMVAVAPFDWQVHDSYFIVAHLHYVLIGGVLFPILAASYYWCPLLRGHTLSERIGRWVFALVFGGFHLAFFPMHIAGILGMPRRIYTYDAGLGWDGLNLASSIGAAVLATGMVLLLFDMVRSSRKPPRAHDNPWRAPTLEWLPSANYNTRSIPQITSSDPLWDQPDLAGQVERGQHWLPGTATGLRETLVTSPVDARPMHLIVLPRWSWLPFIAALGTAGFFLLLTVKWVVTAFACGIVAIVCVLAWLWETDRLPAQATAPIGDGVSVPVGGHGARSHSWWATVILLVVDFSVWASMAFAHIHVAMRSDICPPAGARLPDTSALLWATASLALSTTLAWSAGIGRQRHTLAASRCVPLLLAGVLLTLAFAALWAGHEASLAPRVRAWDATVAALLFYAGFHTLLMLLCAGYLCARMAKGLSTPRQRATFDNVLLLWIGTSVQGVLTAWLPGMAVRALG